MEIRTIEAKAKETRTEIEREAFQDYENRHGPLSVLYRAVEERGQVLISLRNNHKLLAYPRAFDRHCNMVLTNVKDLWSEKGQERDRYISKMFLRGDGVILVLRV